MNPIMASELPLLTKRFLTLVTAERFIFYKTIKKASCSTQTQKMKIDYKTQLDVPA